MWSYKLVNFPFGKTEKDSEQQDQIVVKLDTQLHPKDQPPIPDIQVLEAGWRLFDDLS